MKYSYNPPGVIKKMFASFQWESKVDKILLTFDDGPIPETTPLILEILSRYNIKAAFSVWVKIFKGILNFTVI